MPMVPISGTTRRSKQRPVELAHGFFFLAALLGPMAASAQAGPPFLTNDPGTPGNANWEINLASAQTLSHGVDAYQLPQIDINFGLGERVQLTYQVPYVLQNVSGQPRSSGWSNGYLGVKWRFLDQGKGGWQVSTFPQLETNGSASALRTGIAIPGPRLLLPVEVTKQAAGIDWDFEAGYYPPRNGVRERFFGLFAGRTLSDRWDVGLELYNDRPFGAPVNETTLDLGGRFKLGRGLIALFSAGRSVGGTSDGQPEFIGYMGLQILLSDYGRSLTSEDSTALKP